MARFFADFLFKHNFLKGTNKDVIRTNFSAKIQINELKMNETQKCIVTHQKPSNSFID